jgi:hypothetical protein
MALSVCSGCGRHVRGASCPFCGASVAGAARATRPRVSRAARILGVAALGVACGGTTSPSDGGTDGAPDDVSTQPLYGAVPPDGGFDAQQPSDAGDAGDAADAADAPDDTGVALYGAPPPPDGG